MVDIGDGPAAPADPLSLLATPFDELPPEMVVRAFGVDYGHVHLREGGDLYVTRYGWPHAPLLTPDNWHADNWYAKKGLRLRGSGHVYHVRTKPVRDRSLDLVVKFSRVAQDVPLVVATTFPEDIPPEVIANARFNGPMEEFGLLMELRRGDFGPRAPRMLTHRPLAIYAPPEEHKSWQLGRSRDTFHAHRFRLAKDQENAPKAIELDIKRIYVLLYDWLKGKDAEQALKDGDISEQDFSDLTPRVIEELSAKGFEVLDNKPVHFILRNRRRDQEIMRRGARRLVYGLVDFELLQRTQEHKRRFKTERRERYWRLQSHPRASTPAALPSDLKPTTVFGVDYVFGATPDGGKLWVVGHDPDLRDYFLPDRWRRTPRINLASTSEAYLTRTRDAVYFVYRRSRVGMRPRVEPLFDRGKRIRKHGYNSPFEEVALAERLRRSGILTAYPRAVYRTGHPSTRPILHWDNSRFASHESLMTPEPAPGPLLSPHHDYYSIWGYYRGIDPHREGRGGKDFRVLDVEQAREEGRIGDEEFDGVLSRTKSRLRAAGFVNQGIENHQMVVSCGEDGKVRRDEGGEVAVTLSVDAFTAHEFGLLSESAYRESMSRLRAKLEESGCEMLDPNGRHLLLSMSPNGKFKTDQDGRIETVLCNFELIRPLPPRSE
ncbi:MAG: hypothetical protein ABII00_01530 [Elusimicrobiota bacterium]